MRSVNGVVARWLEKFKAIQATRDIRRSMCAGIIFGMSMLKSDLQVSSVPPDPESFAVPIVFCCPPQFVAALFRCTIESFEEAVGRYFSRFSFRALRPRVKFFRLLFSLMFDEAPGQIGTKFGKSPTQPRHTSIRHPRQ